MRREGIAVLSSAPRELTLGSAEQLSDGGGFIALSAALALDWGISQEVDGSSCESRSERRLEIELVEARLRRPTVGGGIRSPHENPVVIGTISDKRPLAALDLALVDTKLLDAGRGRGELIASLLSFSSGIARVVSKGGLLFGVSLELLLSWRIRDRLGCRVKASSRRQRQRSPDYRKNDSRKNGSPKKASKEGKLKDARRGRKRMCHM